MPELVPESVILLLDTSRSMFRTDYSPNRLIACKQGIRHFLETRQQNEATLDGESAFSLISVDSHPKILVAFDEYDPIGKIDLALSTLAPQGHSAMGDGIGFALKVLIDDIRFSGARFPHIVILSDGKFTKSRVNALKMAKLAKQTNIVIDALRIGEISPSSVLKQITQITGGKYYFANNVQEILTHIQQLATAHILPTGSGYGVKKGIISRKVLKKIASPLKTESQMNKGNRNQKELIAQISGTKSYQKCSICFQSNDPISKTKFSIAGGYCPHCGTPMHMSCASQWGKNQDKQGDGTVFRCVHCLYLLKIPKSVQTVVQMHGQMQKEIEVKQKNQARIKSFNVRVETAQNLGEAAMYSACPVCNGIFEEEDQVISCGNPDCNAIYHEPHFKELKNHTCKLCGSKLIRLFK